MRASRFVTCAAAALACGLLSACSSGAAAPAVFVLPETGAAIAGTTRVAVEGDRVVRAIFEIDGVPWAQIETPPFEADLDPSLYPSGDATLRVTAVLADGESITRTVAIVFPASGSPVALTVEGGSGDGSYPPGTRVDIEADPPAAGFVFDRWTGDVAGVASVTSARTSIVVPAGGATVRATYREAGTPGAVSATVETDPVPGTGDAADDPCIWIHPTDPGLSTVIGTDKSGFYLLVYALDGTEIQRVSTGKMNNVDLRYNFPLGGTTVALVTATNRSNDTIEAYTVNPATRQLEAAGSFAAGLTVYGMCMYVSPVTGDYYVFVNSSGGEVEQWRLGDGGSGVSGTLVRSFQVGSIVEGCVADDELGHFYVAEEPEGIWKYGAEPGDGTSRTLVDGTGSGGNLAADVEGLAIYYAAGGAGYLLASSQGDDSYVVYERAGDNAFVMKFNVVSGGGIDGTSDTDGIDVTNFALGPSFPQGLFVVQDGGNDSARQNFKLVPWESVANANAPPLLVDTSWDPRLVGK